ncbi:MAG: hypothetical protein ACOC6G_04170 [Thermoproteota archaeon]
MGKCNSVAHYEVEGKGCVDLMEEDWDYLVVLDACRYDYFEDLYSDYLDGTLKWALSPASDTREWLEKVFRGKYGDTVYVSANPHINSKGVDVGGNGFYAGEHFPEIVDVWGFGWDEKMKTVPPEAVNIAAVDTDLVHPDQRLIIHYLQPHAPYLSLFDYPSKSLLNYNDLDVVIHSLRNGVLQRAWQKLSFDSPFFTRMIWKIKRALSKNSVVRPIDFELKKVGRDGVLKAYADTLRSVLKGIKGLLKHLSGKIVITADHGELLGEKNEWGHHPHHHVPQLLEVPYFETSA